MDVLGEAGGLIRGSIELNQNTRNAVDNARNMTDLIGAEVREFIKNKYQTFMGEVEANKQWDWKKDIDKF
jgi:hypothetical protein